MWMRVAIGLYGFNIAEVKRVYRELSSKLYIHATPTLFNAGTLHNQLASCFLVGCPDDSINGIFKSLGQCAEISKHAGGIGISIHDIRSKGARIHGTNGTSNGIVPMLKVYNDTAKYVDQGGGKRNGSFAIYLEPWHPDIEDFLCLRKNHGDENLRARDLFYALWIPDLFMKRVENDGMWTLMDPSACPGLSTSFGTAFETLYEDYESRGFGTKTMKAQEMWKQITSSQRETGTPYMLYKDSCNRKSNQQNLGTIKSSNLCTEIIEFSSKDETAVCNLASISLPTLMYRPYRFVRSDIVTIEVVENCPYCTLAKAFLEKCFAEDNVDSSHLIFHQGVREEGKTFPRIFVNRLAIGGYLDTVLKYGYDMDYDKLEQVAKSVTRNLNQAIDRTYYPIPEARNSNLRHRPIGIGVQGLSDVFMMRRIAFESFEAKEMNERIFETIYHGAMTASCELAEERKAAVFRLKQIAKDCGIGQTRRMFLEEFWTDEVSKKPENFAEIRALLDKIQWQRDIDWDDACDLRGSYSSFDGSPLWRGSFQFDLWSDSSEVPKGFDWDALRQRIQMSGVRNSLLVAPMPTASTSQILGNNECIEPITANIYLRRTLAGEFIVVNKYMVEDLTVLGLWSNEMKEKILYHEGSVQEVSEMPSHLRNVYKTVWEISQKVIIDLAADRGKFVCQSQSMNLFLMSPTQSQLSSMHFYAWKKGLKTGMYYLRTKPATKAAMFTLSADTYAKPIAASKKQVSGEDHPDTDCLVCSA